MRRDGDDVIVRGWKTMVTGGAIADAYMTYVMNPENDDLAVVIVDRDAPGVIVQPIATMGLRSAGLASVSFEDARIPAANVMQAANGLDHVQAFLNPRRALLSCAPIGRMERIIIDCVESLGRTIRYGQPLTAMQIVQARLGKMQMAVHVSRMLVEQALLALEEGSASPLFDEIVSTAKYQVTEHALAVAIDALHLMGGRGYACSTPVERYLRDFCGLIPGAGSQDILQTNIGLMTIGRGSHGG